MELPKTETLTLDQIKPYWRNPRRIPDEAVEAVATSIQRYGYTQPIVVDKDHTIIVGHTRLLALQKLGYPEIEVYVTDLPPEKAQEYRLVDNRTSEMSEWSYDALVTELREWESDLVASFFPEVQLEADNVAAGVGAVTAHDVEAGADKALQGSDSDADPTTKVVCPSCFHTFEVRTSSLPGMTRGEMAHGEVG